MPDEPWKELKHELTHILFATVLFVALALAAIGLYLFAHALEGRIPWYLTAVFIFLSEAVLFVDAVCFFAFLATRLITSLIDRGREIKRKWNNK